MYIVMEFLKPSILFLGAMHLEFMISRSIVLFFSPPDVGIFAMGVGDGWSNLTSSHYKGQYVGPSGP